MQERRFILKAFNDFCEDEYDNVLDVLDNFRNKFSYESQLNVAFGFKMLHSFLIRNYARINSPEMADGLIFDYAIEMQNQDNVERRLRNTLHYCNKFYCAWYIANEFITYLTSIEMERKAINDIQDNLIEEGYDEKMVKNW